MKSKSIGCAAISGIMFNAMDVGTNLNALEQKKKPQKYGTGEQTMIETVCKYVINAGTEMSECTCYRKNKCEYQNPDYNPDGRINVVTCEKYLPEPPEKE